METLNDRIRRVVDESGLTKTEFAKRINISQPTVSMFCSGKANPSDRTIADICREFRVNETWLRTGEGRMMRDDTQQEKLERFFADVLTSAPESKRAFIAALSALPPEFYGMIADLAEAYVKNLLEQKKED